MLYKYVLAPIILLKVSLVLGIILEWSVRLALCQSRYQWCLPSVKI